MCCITFAALHCPGSPQRLSDTCCPPSRLPCPRSPAFNFTPLDQRQRGQADSLITIFENASLQPRCECRDGGGNGGSAVPGALPCTRAPAAAYLPARPHRWLPLPCSLLLPPPSPPADGFAEILKDGRGITFGRAGFTTATGDGLWVLMRYQELKPENNSLRQYIPEFLRIQYLRKGINATLSNEVGVPAGTLLGGRCRCLERHGCCCSVPRLLAPPAPALTRSLSQRSCRRPWRWRPT